MSGRSTILSLVIVLFSVVVFTGDVRSQGPKSLEVSEADGRPVLFKHLPDSENAERSALFFRSSTDLRSAIADQPILDLIDFAGGTEAASAQYPAGRLLIVEFVSPQASIETDQRVREFLATDASGPPFAYRRVGNYNVFVFDATDINAANSLIDEVKYEKSVQWLGEDPYLLRRVERYFVTTTRDIFISTVVWIIGGLGISVLTGVVSGFIFYRFREQQRAKRETYSDAGGLTRLNLDDLSEPIIQE